MLFAASCIVIAGEHSFATGERVFFCWCSERHLLRRTHNQQCCNNVPFSDMRVCTPSPLRKLSKSLRRALGFRPAKLGNGTGHDVWTDGNGRTCHPVLRHKDVAIAVVYSLSMELEAKGIVPRRQFMKLLRAA